MKIAQYNYQGSFNNYVTRQRQISGQSNFYSYKVGPFSFAAFVYQRENKISIPYTNDGAQANL